MPKKLKRKTAPKGRKSEVATAVKEEAPPPEASAENSENAEVEVWDQADPSVDISEQTAGILAVVQDLEGQVDTAYELKEAVEADLMETQRKLSEAVAAKEELEARVGSLETAAGAASQLREDISFAEGERNRFESLLAETQKQLEVITQERDSLAERLSPAEARAEELERENTALDAEVTSLKETIAHMDTLRSELADVTQGRENLDKRVGDLEGRLEACEVARNSLDADLAESNKVAGELHEEVESLQGGLAATNAQVGDVRGELKEQQRSNKELLQSKKLLEVKLEETKNRVEAAKKALYDIRSQITRATGRVRQRYFQPKGEA